MIIHINIFFKKKLKTYLHVALKIDIDPMLASRFWNYHVNRVLSNKEKLYLRRVLINCESKHNYSK